MRPKKKKRRGTKRPLKTKQPDKVEVGVRFGGGGRNPRPVIKDGQRVYVLRNPDAFAKMQKLKHQRETAETEEERQAVDKAVYEVGHDWPKTVIGLLTHDPDVVLDPTTQQVIPGAKCIPGDTFYLESQIREILKQGHVEHPAEA